MRNLKIAISLLLGSGLVAPALAQDTGIIGPSPYEFTTQNWMQ
jgi:hypothetical protein